MISLLAQTVDPNLIDPEECSVDSNCFTITATDYLSLGVSALAVLIPILMSLSALIHVITKPVANKAVCILLFGPFAAVVYFFAVVLPLRKAQKT